MTDKPTYDELLSKVSVLEKELNAYKKKETVLNTERRERNALEKKLIKSEERFHLAMEVSKDGIWDWDVEADWVYYSTGFIRMLGYDKSHGPLNLNFWMDKIHPDDKEYVLKSRQACIDNVYDDFELKYRVLNKNKKWIWILGRGRVVKRDLNGKALRIIGTHKDITDWKVSEQKIIQNRKEILSIFRSAPIGIGVVRDRIITRANAKLENITGYSKSELIGRNIRILYPSQKEYERVGTEKYCQIKKSGTGTVETRWIKKDGEIIDILVSSTPIDYPNLSKGVTFTALNITKSKKNERALLESEEKYRTMMDAQEDPTYICSSDMRIYYMNPAMIKWIGEDATGRICHEAIWENPVKCPWCKHSEVMNGKAVTTEVRVPDSGQIYHVSNAPIHHTDGAISKLTSYRNITDITQLNMRLQQAQKMETIGTLAGGIAHDFNNILFPILGYAEILKIDTPPDDVSTHESINQIHSSALRAKALVSQILTFARQEETEYKPLQVQLILNEAIKLLRSTIPKEIEIKKYVARDCRPIVADATQVHQVIMNLTTNAYQAMADHGGTLTIQLEEIQLPSDDRSGEDIDNGRYARLVVADTGSGMTDEVLSKIFDPFFTTKKKGKGTGMGLSVVHGIVKKMNGHIRVKTGPGQGTEFQVYFPIDLTHAVDNAEPFGDQTIPKGHETILLVDDELPIIRMQTRILERLGYKVKTETDALSALSVFEKEPDQVDLVIMDLSMPKMSGDKLAAKLVSIRPDIPIIICTGFGDKLTPEHAQQIGIKSILMKPVIMKEMSLKIREALG